MGRAVTLMICLLSGVLFGWAVPLSRLLATASMLTAPLSIIAAALLVRLNRTMPSLDWKSLDRDTAKALTKQIVELTREYLVILAVVAGLLMLMAALAVVGEGVILGPALLLTDGRGLGGWPPLAQRGVAGLIGVLTTLAVTRMAYVVWRDVDIARLQKTLIDKAADAAHLAEQQRLAEEKTANITKANLRSIANGPSRPWDD